MPHRPPSHPPQPAPPHRWDLSREERDGIALAASAGGVAPGPWLAWAEAAAEVYGPREAARLAAVGAAEQFRWSRGHRSLAPVVLLPETDDEWFEEDPRWHSPPPRLRDRLRGRLRR